MNCPGHLTLILKIVSPFQSLMFDLCQLLFPVDVISFLACKWGDSFGNWHDQWRLQ